MAKRPGKPADEAAEATDDIERRDDALDAAGDDTGDESSGSIAPRRVEGEGPGRKQAPPTPKFVDDPRAEIAAAFDRRKKADGADPDEGEGEEEEDSEDEEAELHGDDDLPEDEQGRIVRHGEERQPARAAREPVELHDDDIVRIKVDGRDLEITYKELKGRTQQLVAADSRFAEADRVLNAARDASRARQPESTRTNADAGNQGDRDEGREDNRRDAASIDRTRLLEIADKIQGGTAEDGADALANLVESVVNGAGHQRFDEDRLADRLMGRISHQQETQQAVSRFQADYGSMFAPGGEYEELGQSVFRGVSAEMLRDMEAAGVPESYLDDLARSENPSAAILDAHNQYRAGRTLDGQAIEGHAKWGHNFRSYSDLLISAADRVAAKYGVPKISERDDRAADGLPIRGNGHDRTNGNGNGNGRQSGSPARFTISERRQVEKRELSPQPRPASSIRSDNRQQGQAPRLTADARASAVANMRRDRQQTV